MQSRYLPIPKFRVYDRYAKKWIHDVALLHNGTLFILRTDNEFNRLVNDFYSKKGDFLHGDYANVDYTDWYAIENCVIQRCIDETDIQGFEIFEGDILETDEADWTGRVVFDSGAFMLVDSKGVFSSMPNWSQCKIIGNIAEEKNQQFLVKLKSLEEQKYLEREFENYGCIIEGKEEKGDNTCTYVVKGSLIDCEWFNQNAARFKTDKIKHI